MTKIGELARAMREFDDRIIKCMRCGTCQSVCPVFTETHSEADVARGKLFLLSKLSEEMLKDPKLAREKLDRCLLCGSCQAACPSGVNTMAIFLEARALNARYMGLSPIKRLIFRGLLSHPRLFDFLSALSAPFRPVFMRPQKNAARTAKAPLLDILAGERRIPQMPRKTFSAEFGRIDLPPGKSGLKVLFFPGCMGDKVYTNVTKACVKIFKHHGVGVCIPASMACCGIPALASGDRDAFQKMAHLNIEIFKREKYDYIVTACASCTETIKEMWPKYAESDDDKKYAAMAAAKALDISEFIVDVLKVRNGPASKKASERVTYHDSCHLKKSLGVSAQPRVLIRMNAACELVEMPESDKCCGCGGSFTLTHYEISKQIGKRKRDNIVSVSPDVVAAGCPACMMQISNMLALNNDDIKVKHVAEIYADSLVEAVQ